ncbi:MAG: aminotransferase class I/II-fold pyridoxal phosphate-dependent enzyme, partial [Gammaproteobacteria bacterium]|nr:aminotransferase class I/II-fold pyridoxal phosphate-dependent enzyme [Gammaproteobacteria bacterium]
ATTIVRRMIEADELDALVVNAIKPFYRSRVAFALSVCHEVFAGLPYAIHEAEGAFFLWLWFPDLPISALELYRRLKQRGVVVLPGNYFFPGLDEPWHHGDECIRISYAQDESTIREGLTRIAAEIRSLMPFGEQEAANA